MSFFLSSSTPTEGAAITFFPPIEDEITVMQDSESQSPPTRSPQPCRQLQYTPSRPTPNRPTTLNLPSIDSILSLPPPLIEVPSRISTSQNLNTSKSNKSNNQNRYYNPSNTNESQSQNQTQNQDEEDVDISAPLPRRPSTNALSSLNITLNNNNNSVASLYGYSSSANTAPTYTTQLVQPPPETELDRRDSWDSEDSAFVDGLGLLGTIAEEVEG